MQLISIVLKFIVSATFIENVKYGYKQQSKKTYTIGDKMVFWLYRTI